MKIHDQLSQRESEGHDGRESTAGITLGIFPQKAGHPAFMTEMETEREREREREREVCN